MHFAIVEDLIADQERLIELIKKDCLSNHDEAAFTCFPNGESFLGSYRPGLYSAVFLDIILEKMTGIETARKIREQDCDIPIIFTTAEKEFALKSYDVHALDYLVKPLETDRLAWCMKSIRDSMQMPLYIEIRENSGQSVSNNHFLRLDDILYAESFRSRLIIHTVDGDISSNHTLAEFTELLPETKQFFECGRGLLVNLSQIDKVMPDGEIKLKNNQNLYCSRRKQKETRDAFIAYLFECMREKKH